MRPIIVPVGPSIAYIPLTRGLYTLVDREFGSMWLAQWNWHAKWDRKTRSFYAARIHYPFGKMRVEFMHNDTCFARKFETVDHRSGSSLDNRKANLRSASRSEQQWNKGLQRNNTSGVKGVCFNRRTGLYQVKIKYRGVVIRGGAYRSLEFATDVRRELALRLHGEFAYERRLG